MHSRTIGMSNLTTSIPSLQSPINGGSEKIIASMHGIFLCDLTFVLLHLKQGSSAYRIQHICVKNFRIQMRR